MKIEVSNHFDMDVGKAYIRIKQGQINFATVDSSGKISDCWDVQSGFLVSRSRSISVPALAIGYSGCLHGSFLEKLNNANAGDVIAYRNSKIKVMDDQEIKDLVRGKTVFNLKLDRTSLEYFGFFEKGYVQIPFQTAGFRDLDGFKFFHAQV